MELWLIRQGPDRCGVAYIVIVVAALWCQWWLFIRQGIVVGQLVRHSEVNGSSRLWTYVGPDWTYVGPGGECPILLIHSTSRLNCLWCGDDICVFVVVFVVVEHSSQ